MKDIIKKLTSGALLALALLSPALVFAAAFPTLQPPPTSQVPFAPTTIDQFIVILGKVLNWISQIFWIAAILFIFFAAFYFLTAAGNDERLRKAKQQLLYAVIAIAVALFSTVVPTLIDSFLGGR